MEDSNEDIALEETGSNVRMEGEGKKGYKKTKLGWIPEEWSTPKINEVFEFLKTTSFSRNQLNYHENNDVFYLHYGDIHAKYKKPLLDFEIESNVPKLNAEVKLPNSVQYLADGDVIIADASEDYEGVGEAIEIKNLKNKKAISGLHTFALRDFKERTVEGFRGYIFKNPNVRKALKTIATGSKVYGISKSNVQKFRIVLPPLPEQLKIAGILGTWDKAIAAQEKLITKKQKLKKGLMQQLLTRKKRFPGFEGEWKTSKLGDLFSIQGRVGWKGYKKEDLREYGPIVIGAKHITDQLLDLNDPTFLSQEKYEESPEIMIKINDLLIVQRGSLGKVVLIEKNIGDATINPSMAILRPKTDNISVQFIYYFLCSDFCQRLIMSETSSTGVPMISQKQIGTFKIYYPKLKEQKKIVTLLQEMDKEILNLRNNQKAIIKQKQGLIQQLLTGEKRVKI